MRSIALLLSLALLHAASAIDGDYSPFSDPLFGQSNDELVVKRQNGCQSGYNSCSAQGDSGACCPNGSNCANDAAGNVACCPTGALCTGVISGTAPSSLSTGTPTTSGVVLGTTSTLSTITTDFASPVGLPTTGVAGGGSTVPNSFYPFVYIPTSYANGDLCLTAYSYCQSQSTACASSLGGANGVTVSGFGGGITVQGASGTTLDPSSASSICSSLSQQACYGVSEAQCGVATNGATTATSATFVQAPNRGPRQTPCPGIVYAAGAGAVMGLRALL